jgi:hypothetical protein
MAVRKPVNVPKHVKLSHPHHQKPHADPGDIVISVDDSVKWDYQGDFVVVFEDESPFDSWYFYPGNDTSGKPKAGVKHNHPYKYSVHIDGEREDPNVIIRP